MAATTPAYWATAFTPAAVVALGHDAMSQARARQLATLHRTYDPTDPDRFEPDPDDLYDLITER